MNEILKDYYDQIREKVLALPKIYPVPRPDTSLIDWENRPHKTDNVIEPPEAEEGVKQIEI